MKKIALFLALASVVGFTSCSENDGPEGGMTQKEKTLSAAVSDYVNKTVVPTYRNLADESIELAEICEQMKNAPSQAELQKLIGKAGDKWKEAREHWELSEAFLYGAAADYNIDPHIDSWPIDYDQLDHTLRTQTMMDKLSENDNDAIKSLGYSLLGFHALEYMLFSNGEARKADTLTPEMLIYTAAVARDLRNQTILLEAAWSPAGISPEKSEMLEDAELEANANYGEYMLNSGKAGSIYKSYTAAAQQILQGCFDIADEVANTKIYTAYSSSDVDYIESPHAKNSCKDFADNIRSIKNSYCGTNASDHSVSDYIKSIDPNFDKEVREAIDASIAAFEAAKKPFVDNISDSSWGTARDVTNHLADLLNEAINKL